MKLKKVTVIMIIVCILGLSLLLYPTVSNYWNEKHATKAINDYVSQIKSLNEEEYEKLWVAAIGYNDELRNSQLKCELTADLEKKYNEMLNADGHGVMGYIDIKKLGVSLPIYHGTSDEVLQSAIGHVDWSSLPTGSENTHCVLSGHRGLPAAKLFTDLDKLREGDTFTISVLNEVLTYQVNQIRTVEPESLNNLQIEPGKDLCTLVTCTPYGINTHRLLVRGHRVQNSQDAVTLIPDGIVINQLMVALFFAIPLLFTLFLIIMFKKPVNTGNTK